MQSLRLILDRFDHNKAIFLTQEGQQLVWNRDDLPEDIREGGQYYVQFSIENPETRLSRPAKDMTQKPLQEKPVETEGVPLPSVIPAPPQKTSSSDEEERRKLARTILEEILNGSEPTS